MHTLSIEEAIELGNSITKIELQLDEMVSSLKKVDISLGTLSGVSTEDNNIKTILLDSIKNLLGTIGLEEIIYSSEGDTLESIKKALKKLVKLSQVFIRKFVTFIHKWVGKVIIWITSNDTERLSLYNELTSPDFTETNTFVVPSEYKDNKNNNRPIDTFNMENTVLYPENFIGMFDEKLEANRLNFKAYDMLISSGYKTVVSSDMKELEDLRNNDNSRVFTVIDVRGIAYVGIGLFEYADGEFRPSNRFKVYTLHKSFDITKTGVCEISDYKIDIGFLKHRLQPSTLNNKNSISSGISEYYKEIQDKEKIFSFFTKNITPSEEAVILERDYTLGMIRLGHKVMGSVVRQYRDTIIVSKMLLNKK